MAQPALYAEIDQLKARIAELEAELAGHPDRASVEAEVYEQCYNDQAEQVRIGGGGVIDRAQDKLDQQLAVVRRLMRKEQSEEGTKTFFYMWLELAGAQLRIEKVLLQEFGWLFIPRDWLTSELRKVGIKRKG